MPSVARLIVVLGLSASLLAACGSPEPAPQAPSARPAAPAHEVQEPVAIPRRPLTGEQRLDLSMTVRDEAGRDRPLAELLSGPSLLLFIDSDTKDKDNRAATRMLRDVAQAGAPVGFRLVVLFTKGTPPESIPGWFEGRGVTRTGTAAVDHEGAFAAASGWEPRSAALLEPDGTVGLFWPRSERWDARLGTEGMTADLLFRAWEHPHAPPAVDEATRAAAVELAHAALRAEWDGDVLPAALEPLVGAAGLGAPVEHAVWVELYRHGVLDHPRARVAGGTLGAGIAEAVRRASLGSKDGAASWREAADAVMVSVQLESARSELPTRALSPLWFLVEPGIDGIVLAASGSEGIVLPSEAVTDGLLTPRVRGRNKKLPRLFEEAARRAGASGRAWLNADGTTLSRFRTTAFGQAVPGGAPVTMVRGNVPLDGPLGPEPILDSIREGGRWLLGTVRDNGKFDYEYFPNQDEGSRGYNIVRHAGSVYGLFEMFTLARHEEGLKADADAYIEAASRAMGYVYEGLAHPRGAPEGRVCLIDRGACESGSAALTLLTFLVRPDPAHVPPALRDKIFHADDERYIEGLGLTLTDMIDDQGAVFRRYRDVWPSEGEKGRVKKEPLYYPGETMLALMLLYEQTQDERWLKGARAIGQRQVRLYQRNRMQFPDHWVMQALPRLYRVDPSPELAEVSFAMAVHSISEQYPAVWTPFPDYRGAWRREDDIPRTTRAGSRAEALRAVMYLAWELENAEMSELIEGSLIELARHLAERQFTPRNSWWTPDPQRVRGAYPMGIVDNHCRIDNNQHALVGMVGSLHAARRRAGEEVDLSTH